MANSTFLGYTEDVIDDLLKSTDDIEFIGSADGEFECKNGWGDFMELANFCHDIFMEQDTQIVPTDLIIAFKDGGKLVMKAERNMEFWDYIPDAKFVRKVKKPMSIERLKASDTDSAKKQWTVAELNK